jgi:hypothetical protein
MVVAAGLAFVALLTGTAGGAAADGRAEPFRLGVFGDMERFAQVSGQRSQVEHVIMGWHQGQAVGRILEGMGSVPLLGIKTGGVITPRDIAVGRGDSTLLALNAALAADGRMVYLRPLPEMNGHWNDYCAYDREGRPRGPSHSTEAFRNAFARIALLARGGSRASINRQLRSLGLPTVISDLAKTRARIMWNPQGYGAPDLPGNSAQAYYPGDAYVDVVANDLYDQRFNAAWDANERLYQAHPGKPFAIAEWGLWGVDDPAFVERMAAFVRSHPRTELLAYYHGNPGSPWDLTTKPRSRAAYRRLISPLG